MEEAFSQSPRPSQKKKKKSKKTDVLLDFMPAKEGHAGPFVGYFSSGFDAEHYKQGQGEEGEGHEEKESIRAFAYQNTERYKGRQHQLVVTPPDVNVDFVGTNYLGEGALWQPGNYALGVFDKDSLTLELVPLSGAKVLRLEPRVRGLGYDVESLSATSDVELTKDLLIQKRNLLTSTFGTHKSRIMQKRYERGHVKEDALGDKEEIGRLFQKAGDNVSVLTNEEALQQANASVKRNIPPHDPTATTPEKAYPFDAIISAEEAQSLDDLELLKEAIGNEEKIDEFRKAKAYPEFVLKRLDKLKNYQEQLKIRGLAILSYMRHLLAFYDLPRKVMASIVDPNGSHGDLRTSKAIDLGNYANIPHEVVSKLLNLFTSVDQGERIQTSEKRNLLISYILVLGLMIDNFHADPFDLAVELRKSIMDLKAYYMELGCKYKAVKEVDRGDVDFKSGQRRYEAILPLPLQFPGLKNKTRRKN